MSHFRSKKKEGMPPNKGTRRTIRETNPKGNWEKDASILTKPSLKKKKKREKEKRKGQKNYRMETNLPERKMKERKYYLYKRGKEKKESSGEKELGGK